MFSRQTFDTLDDPTSSPPAEEAEEEEQKEEILIQQEPEIDFEHEPEMEEVDYHQVLNALFVARYCLIRKT